jgi:hypothetical protein
MRVRVAFARDKAASRKVDGSGAGAEGIAGANDAPAQVPVARACRMASRRGGQSQAFRNRMNDARLMPSSSEIASKEIER